MHPDDSRLARIEQVRLVFFIVRHIVGIAVFLWLTMEARRLDDGPMWLVVAGFGTIYAVFAFVSGRKLLAMYRRRLLSAQGRRQRERQQG